MIYGRELPGHPYNFRAKATRCLVAARRLIFGKWLSGVSSHAPLAPCASGQAANDMIRNLLDGDAPCLVARFGCGEMESTLRGIDIRAPGGVLRKTLRMATGESGPFWWDNSIRAGLCWNAGFFPPDDSSLDAFSRRVCEDARSIDILGAYLPGEKQIGKLFAPQMKAVPIVDLEPFDFSHPWTEALAGHKVLVVSSFKDTVEMQYAKRGSLFADPAMLPEFTLHAYRSISSFAGNKVPYASWFDALEKMCNDISRIDFDIAIIGCGAYGMSLGAFVKRELGRKAFHIGAAVQLLFGIKGSRWDRCERYSKGLYNGSWTRPLASDTVGSTATIEGGCYW